MTPESKVFKCALPAEKLAQLKKSALINNRILLPTTLVVYVIIMVRNFYLTSGGEWSSLFSAVNIYLIALWIVLLVILIKFMVCMAGKYTMKSDLIDDKEFSWNAATNEFTYKDKNRTLRFSGNKVTKWMIHSSQKASVDILRLNNGEQIVLEHEFNPDIHPFLEENKAMLHLPDFSALSLKQLFFLNYYKNAI